MTRRNGFGFFAKYCAPHFRYFVHWQHQIVLKLPILNKQVNKWIYLLPPSTKLADYVIDRVCVCLSVCQQDYCKSNQSIFLKLGVMIGPINLKNRLTFGGDAVPDTDSGSRFHFPHNCGMGIVRDLLAFLIQPPDVFTIPGEMTDADKIMNPPQCFGNDPADIRIRIRINPEIRIWMSDHFLLRLDALAEVCAL